MAASLRFVRKSASLVLTVLFGHFAMTGMAFGGSTKAEHNVAAKPTIVAARGVPLYFETNQGQTDGQIRFLTRAGG